MFFCLLTGTIESMHVCVLYSSIYHVYGLSLDYALGVVLCSYCMGEALGDVPVLESVLIRSCWRCGQRRLRKALSSWPTTQTLTG